MRGEGSTPPCPRTTTPHLRDPGHFVIGYWLGGAFTGHGSMTAACRALIRSARDQVGAIDIFVGVTKGKLPARRCFVPVADQGTPTRGFS